jgi:hypothetical protein
MAGLGRKVFVAGDVLTAAQVQGYLQDQSIMLYASGTARDAAIPSPSEGMFVYLSSTDALTFYDGSTWKTYPSALSETTITNGTAVNLRSTTGTAVNTTLVAPEELITIAASNASGTVALNAITTGVTYYSGTATGNWTVNLRADGTTTLNSQLAVGQSITHTFLATQGTPTAFYSTAVQVDGTAVTPQWQGGSSPSSGNASSVDAYTYTVIKTATTPTYLVLASQTQFKA